MFYIWFIYCLLSSVGYPPATLDDACVLHTNLERVPGERNTEKFYCHIGTFVCLWESCHQDIAAQLVPIVFAACVEFYRFPVHFPVQLGLFAHPLHFHSPFNNVHVWCAVRLADFHAKKSGVHICTSVLSAVSMEVILLAYNDIYEAKLLVHTAVDI